MADWRGGPSGRWLQMNEVHRAPECLLLFAASGCCQCFILLLQMPCKVMAKSLIRNRHAVTKLHGLKSQLQAVSLRIQV